VTSRVIAKSLTEYQRPIGEPSIPEVANMVWMSLLIHVRS
jgi:hypothetical protein